MATVALLYKGMWWLCARTLLKKLLVTSPSGSVNRDFEQIFQHTVGVQRLKSRYLQTLCSCGRLLHGSSDGKAKQV
uniref:Secreted protein n=1 Tax=Peronospora matthiolae TaxID=2874970 RepID=A0AAV1U786_9STRA